MSEPVPPPSDTELSAFISGQIDGERAAQIERYLESDEEAAHRFAGISLNDPLVEKLQKSRYRSNLYHKKNAEIASGTCVDRYVIKDLIGRGGMAAVYRAHDPVIDRVVALKILRQRNDTDVEALNEAKMQGGLNHPNVVSVYDANICEHGVYIAMELMDQSVAELLTDQKYLPPEQAARIMLDALKGVQAAHDQGLIHRDIKPANLLLTKSGLAKVADFGISRSIGSDTVTEDSHAGTPHFMSPEQCRAGRVDARSDIYALGATLHTMLTGHRPYEDSGSPLEILYCQCESEPPDPRAVRAELPSLCSDLVLCAMAKRPGDRFESASAFADAIKSSLLTATNPSQVSFDSSQHWKKLSAIPTGPALAVLPFENLSNDPTQEYFCDGMTEEITAALARFQELRIIARAATARFKGADMDPQRIGVQLGAEFLLQGSVQRLEHRVRVTASLFEQSTYQQIWTERYDRDLSTSDLFAIQDDLAQRVAAAVGHPSGAAFQVRRKNLLALDPHDLEAHDLVLRWYDYLRDPDANTHASLKHQLESLLHENCQQADAWAALAFLFLDEVRGSTYGVSTDTSLQRSKECADQAVKIEPNSVIGHWALFCAHFHRREFVEFRSTGKRAVSLNPNHPDILADYGLCIYLLGERERGLSLASKAIALSPGVPVWYHAVPMFDCLLKGDYENALFQARQIALDQWLWTPLFLAVCNGLLGQPEQAREYSEMLLSLQPDFGESWERDLGLWNLPEDLAGLIFQGLHLAGLELRFESE